MTNQNTKRPNRSERIKGKNNPFYKGEKAITPLHSLIRASTQYSTWRLGVFERDKFTCQFCGKIGGELEAHHNIKFSKICKFHNIVTIEQALDCKLLWNINNGITLCKKCHREK